MRRFAAVVALLLTTLSAQASAGPAASALGKCLSDNTTGKERKELARWMFVAMSTHPEIKQLSAVTPADLDRSSKATGELFTKLLTENCVTELKAAIQAEGAASLPSAFSILGQVAMQELLSDAAVNAAMGGFERYMDFKKVEALISTK
jgi:hypothetical protein